MKMIVRDSQRILYNHLRDGTKIMKKNVTHSAMKKGLLVLGLALLLSTVEASAQETIRITNGEWEPFHSEYSYQYGFNSHVVSEAFKTQGITVEWGFFPWKRAYIITKEARGWDASAVWWADAPETQRDFWVSDPVGKTSFVFFHRKDRDFEWDSFDDLKGLKIGGTLEYDYGKEFMTAMQEKRIRVDLAPNDEAGLKKLLSGRVDIFPNDPVVGYAQIENIFSPEEAEKLTHHPKEFGLTTLSLIISKKAKNGRFFLEKFNAGLQILKENGTLDRMLQDLEAGKYEKQSTKWSE